MTGLTYLAAALALTALAGGVCAARRRRRWPVRPGALAGAGGRALAANVYALSDLGMGLELPRTRR